MKMGRPSVMTAETLDKLRAVFMIGGSDEEACAAAQIATRTLYDYQNANEDFLQEKNRLKQSPFLKARKTIYDHLDNPEQAKWYLERKLKSEFAQRTELTGKDGKDLPAPILGGVSTNVSSDNSNP